MRVSRAVSEAPRAHRTDDLDEACTAWSRTASSALGIHVPRRGPHVLRHACAGHLLARGLSLKEIADHLGHRSLDSTRIYAKVDLQGLREVAAFDLGGLV